jgi:hypothetical protein
MFQAQDRVSHHAKAFTTAQKPQEVMELQEKAQPTNEKTQQSPDK